MMAWEPTNMYLDLPLLRWEHSCVLTWPILCDAASLEHLAASLDWLAAAAPPVQPSATGALQAYSEDPCCCIP
jgi:hypothetical protein